MVNLLLLGVLKFQPQCSPPVDKLALMYIPPEIPFTIDHLWGLKNTLHFLKKSEYIFLRG